jgi:excisionase family DNA binding protein
MKSQNNLKSYLTPNEVADLLMVSPVTVRQWAQKGQLHALTTPGGHRRFTHQEVERFAREHGISLQRSADGKLRILVVDDDEQFSGYLVELLTGLSDDVVVETARDGFDAGRKIETFRAHVVLLDLMMPGMNGYEVCRVLKTEPATRATRIIALTACPSPENVDLILAAGAEACLGKPLDTDALLTAIGIPNRVAR